MQENRRNYPVKVLTFLARGFATIDPTPPEAAVVRVISYTNNSSSLYNP